MNQEDIANAIYEIGKESLEICINNVIKITNI